MELTEVRINLCGEHGSRLKAFCSLTFDNTFVIRDVKLIDGNDGLFLAMPSRKLCDHCPSCKEKNHLRARYCNNCGRRLNESRYLQYRNGNGHGCGNGHGNGHGHHGSRLKLHADIAHPINAACREEIERRVLEAYDRELERSRQPGYVPPSLDGEDFELYDERPARAANGGNALTGVAAGTLRPTGTGLH
jgi:stage V sporulation protein G